jgi:hypothetical protein
MANDGERRRSPRWLPFPGLAIAAGWAGFEAASGSGMSEFISTLLWPGTALYVLITIATYLGWQQTTH